MRNRRENENGFNRAQEGQIRNVLGANCSAEPGFSEAPVQPYSVSRSQRHQGGSKYDYMEAPSCQA